MSSDHAPGLVVGTADFVSDVVRSWRTLPAGWSLGLVSHVAVDSKDRVYFYQRKDSPVLVFDSDGHFLGGRGRVGAGAEGSPASACTPRRAPLGPRASGERGAHSPWGDSRGNLYLAEVGLNQVTKLARRPPPRTPPRP